MYRYFTIAICIINIYDYHQVALLPTNTVLLYVMRYLLLHIYGWLRLTEIYLTETSSQNKALTFTIEDLLHHNK